MDKENQIMGPTLIKMEKLRTNQEIWILWGNSEAANILVWALVIAQICWKWVAFFEGCFSATTFTFFLVHFLSSHFLQLIWVGRKSFLKLKKSCTVNIHNIHHVFFILAAQIFSMWIFVLSLLATLPIVFRLEWVFVDCVQWKDNNPTRDKLNKLVLVSGFVFVFLLCFSFRQKHNNR